MISLKQQFNNIGADKFPGYLGIEVQSLERGRASLSMAVQPVLMAPNGFLHAGSIVTLADSAAGYGCMASLPEGASGFTTVELKSNFLGTALDGILDCEATAAHVGRTTQVWDAVVTHRGTGRTLALFRCTQMVLYPKG
jgi:1,4-dihydroxy-2-naphthoyl-CoA hydrolase